jgi:hypothetical protein
MLVACGDDDALDMPERGPVAKSGGAELGVVGIRVRFRCSVRSGDDGVERDDLADALRAGGEKGGG